MRPALALLALLAAAPAAAHDGVVHTTGEEAAAHAATAIPFPIEIEARFDLVDHTGRAVTQADFEGQPMLLFFGYASCQAICSTALPRMAEALDLLGAAGKTITPVMITVDPARDTQQSMADALPRYHDRLLGLTGSDTALAEARAAFQVEAKKVADAPDGPIYAHGSFIYLIGPDGRVLALMPPILAPERIAALIEKKINPSSRPAPG